MAERSEWREVGDRVFVRRYEFFDQNIVVVPGDGALLVVDTRSTYGQARELQDDIRLLSSQPWVVLNTHHHFDHTFGNAVFLPADIWGHERCVAAMWATGDLARGKVAQQIPELADELAGVEIAPPTRTFDLEATIDVGGRPVELRHLGRAHTDNDVIALVPDAGVVVAGDVVEEGSPPYFGDSFPLDWPDSNGRLLDLVAGPVVPGHGRVVDRSYVEAQTRDLAAAAQAARAAYADGVAVEDALGSVPFPEPHAGDCVRRAYQQLQGAL